MPDIARKLSIKDITGARLVRSQDEPMHLQIGDVKASRINLMGVVVGSEDAGIVLDDSTGRIEARFSDLPRPMLGDIVLMVARPREFSNSVYLVPDIIRKMSPAWLELRKAELAQENLSVTEKVIRAIQDIDKGDGADIEDIKARYPESEKIIAMLLQSGDVFQVKHGRLKVLE